MRTISLIQGNKFRSLLVLLIVTWSACLNSRHAQAQNAESGKQWALLIGVEKYERVTPLRFTVEDVKRIGSTLKRVGGYAPECILEITDNAECKPTKAAIMDKLPKWLKNVGKNDSLVVYFSGHGFLEGGKGYLAPIDINAADLVGTGIPTAWIRQQLAACPAHIKLLVLDSCHAGAEKGEDKDPGVSAGVLGDSFKDLEGVVTLASSTAAQKSQIWEGKEQSLFSYWLNQGIKGHADRNQDGDIDIDELFNYVSRNVQRTAKDRFSRAQDPRRIIGSDVSGIHVVVHVQPQSLANVLADMSEQLADLIELRKFNRVGVLEFRGGGVGEIIGTDFGLLGQWCADDVQRQLLDFGNGKFSLVDRAKLKSAMEAQGGFGLKDLVSTNKMQQLSKDVGGLPLLAQGTFRNRSGRIVNLQCELVATQGDLSELIGQVAGSAALTEREWAMLGRSIDVKPEDIRRPPPSLDERPKPETDIKIVKYDQKAKGAHPLQDPNFRWPIKIMVDGQERKGIFRGNDYIVPLRKGEEYAVRIENRSGGVTFMQLLVDGFNTNMQADPNVKGISTEVIAPRVSLENARPWVISNVPPEGFKVPTVLVPGFRDEALADGRYGFRKFTVSSVSDSVAGRMKFTDQIGLITLAFYDVKGQSRGEIATAAGMKKIMEVLKVDPNLVMGNLQAVVNIRYVDADSPEFAGR